MVTGAFQILTWESLESLEFCPAEDAQCFLDSATRPALVESKVRRNSTTCQ